VSCHSIRINGAITDRTGTRAAPVDEAMLACVLADHLLRHRAQNVDATSVTWRPRN
jgi:chorismate synthase